MCWIRGPAQRTKPTTDHHHTGFMCRFQNTKKILSYPYRTKHVGVVNVLDVVNRLLTRCNGLRARYTGIVYKDIQLFV